MAAILVDGNTCDDPGSGGFMKLSKAIAAAGAGALLRRACRVPFAAVLCLASACGFPRPADVPDEVSSCTANEFIACEGNIVRTCNETGDGTATQDCGGAGCNTDAKRCNQCVPGSDSCGAGPNEIDHCGADGLPAGQDTCSLACVATPAAHCAYLEPRYLPDVCDKPATMPSFTVSNAASFDTALDANCTGGIVKQDGGPPICVVRYGSITITSMGTLTVSGVRALALVADSAVTVDGVLDVGGKKFASGPGGGTVISGASVVLNGNAGGGAGFATAGASGGSASADGGGGLGGGVATDPSLLTVLVGGPHPAPSSNLGPDGGGGGGAATLIACRGSISVSGTIDAGGGGGGGGDFGVSMLSKFGGAGGGSGGNVVLQGLSITVTGQVFANGGGGGGGMDFQGFGTAGGPGANGTRSATSPASGGFGPLNAGAGGTGGIQGGAPGPGKKPTDTASGFPGGGGGSVGFFQTYTPNGIAPTLTPSAASPTFRPNKLINTR